MSRTKINTTKKQQGLDSRSKRVQFPKAELLPRSNKHRFFCKHGMLVDRLA